ncbi:uncharacterized protein LOC122252286 [Penaeus japonicus]|uniref:uncharacterized protein LOC122252286 n=1 Tax=Penaeus japonicus TaxID=27405 RepID=UPI001C712189|nr:uncharacterized protein LOC122252286 [Penaeus japonicus]
MPRLDIASPSYSMLLMMTCVRSFKECLMHHVISEVVQGGRHSIDRLVIQASQALALRSCHVTCLDHLLRTKPGKCGATDWQSINQDAVRVSDSKLSCMLPDSFNFKK